MPRLTDSQLTGSLFLAQRRCAYLADVPGLGKTAQYLRALDLVAAQRAIIVCPPILRDKLPDELALWSRWGHKITIIESGKDFIPDDGIVVLSYSLVWRPHVLERLLARGRGVLILDEAHRVKSAEAAATMACLGTLAHASTHTWFVSGTPIPNHAGEIYAFAKLAGLWPQNYEAWCKSFCTTKPDRYDPRGWRISGSKNLDELRALIAPAMIRRTEVEGRPPLSVDVIAVEGSDAYATLDPDFQGMLQEAAFSGDYSFVDMDDDALSTVRRLTGIAKIPGTIANAIDAMETGHKRLLVFGWHTDVLEQITEGLKAYGADLVNGSTSAAAADRITRAFQQEDGKPRIIVGNMSTMGEAVTLTAASRGFIAEPAWTPKDNTQVMARAWRKNQKNPVHFSLLAIRGSVDEAITRTSARKAREVASVLD